MSSTLAHDPHRLELHDGFVVSTGIECSAPTIRGGVRQDLLRKTGHWERYAEDLQLIAEFGIRYVRYGIPFHVVAADPERLDWAWTDAAMGALRDAGLEPIVDLLHFGVPDGMTGFGDPRLPRRFADYTRAFAERFPWVRYYTPVNEPLVTAVMSADAGVWNERARTPDALIAAIDNVSTCAVLGMEIIRERRPDAIFIQSDACEGYQAVEPAAQDRTDFLNERRFVAYDLTYGMRPSPAVAQWLAYHGMGEDRLAWFAEHGSREGCILGHDYYRGNEWMVRADGTTFKARDRRIGYAALARQYHARYRMPFMLTETNIAGQYAPGWLAETWNDTLALRAEGLPTRGYCWYAFLDHVDWDSGLSRNIGRQNRCGLVGLDRRPYKVGHTYRDLAFAALDGRYEPLPVPVRRARAAAPSIRAA